MLYADLAWMFQFKMGQNLDDAHFYYKAAWASEMMNVLRGESAEFRRADQSANADATGAGARCCAEIQNGPAE